MKRKVFSTIISSAGKLDLKMEQGIASSNSSLIVKRAANRSSINACQDVKELLLFNIKLLNFLIAFVLFAISPRFYGYFSFHIKTFNFSTST